MKCLVPLLTVLVTYLAVGQAVSYEHLIREEWEGFKLEHGKFYESEAEEQYRFSVFTDNLHFITEHNKLYELGLSTYYVGVNQFADLSHNEFLEMYNMNNTEFLTTENYSEDFQVFNNTYTDEELTEYKDWRTKGAVTRIKNQGQCGSCWTFSCTGALEAQWFLKKGRLIELSEQNILDCSTGSFGCRGGYTTKAYEYIIHNRGIDTEASYRYEGRQMACRFRKNVVGATQTTYKHSRFGDEAALKAIVATIGPASVNIDASDRGFAYFRGGIYNNPRCSSIKGGHLVLTIGYGTQGKFDYWLVKNSWGTNWGEHGYVKMMRNQRNQCGIASYVTYPIV